MFFVSLVEHATYLWLTLCLPSGAKTQTCALGVRARACTYSLDQYRPRLLPIAMDTEKRVFTSSQYCITVVVC